MIIHCFYTKIYTKMYTDFFLRSLKNINFDIDNNLNTKIYDEDGCHYNERCQFAEIHLRKIKWLVDIIQKNLNGERFIYSDVDIAFYKNFDNIIKNLKNDLVFQQSVPGFKINAGFMVIKPTQTTLNFFKQVIKIMEKTGCHDQAAMRKILYSKNNIYKFNYLPYDKFITGGNIVNTSDPNNEKKWKLDERFKDIYMHHGNYSSGIDIKYNQLQFVWNKIHNIG